MPSVSIVGTYHKGLFYGAEPIVHCSSLCQHYTLKHCREERTACTLLCLTSCLLVVEDCQHLSHLRRLVGCKKRFQSCVHHREVVEPSAADELSVETYGTGWCGIIEVEVEIQNILLLHIQFFAYEIQQHTAFKLLVYDAYNGQHILLFAQFHTIVDLTVEMYGKIGDYQQRTLNVQQACLRVQSIFSAQHNTSGKRQGTVHPSAHNRTSINFCVQFHQSSLAFHFALWLNAESRRVAMCTDDMETALCHWFATNAESIER